MVTMIRNTKRFALAAAFGWAITASAGAQGVRPPETSRQPVTETLHGVQLTDPYRWLEDQQAPRTRAWIDAQNTYTASVFDPLPGKERIAKRLGELMKVDVVGMPFIRGGRYFFSKRAATQDLSILYMRRGAKGKDEVLIDPHGMSADHTVSVNVTDVSLDGATLVYSVRNGGEDEVTLRVMDIDSRKELDALPRARYSGVSLTPDRKTVYYAKQTPQGPRVFVHQVGTDAAADRKIFGDGYGPEKIIGAGLTDDGKYLLVNVSYGSAAMKTELYFLEVGKGDALTPIVNDIEATFGGAAAGDTLFVRTNWNAPKYRVIKVDLRHPERASWRDFLPEGQHVMSGLSTVGGRLFVSTIENVQTKIRAYSTDGKALGDVALPGIGAASGVNGDWDKDEAFFAFSSFAQPTTIYRYTVSTGAREVWSKLNVPIDSASIEVKQVWYASKDGTKVPMFVAHRKGLKLDGSNPTLLTGYGGFNASQMPGFSQRAAFWIENGGVYALPNLRGGGEFGEDWHRAGMLGKKQNVFDDFVAAAEWLIANEYTSSQKIAISGGSNGGLLVGAALTQRPELFRAVVCSYPLLDMVRYHKFMVAGYWVPEYGSADASAEQLQYIRAYSPYHNVKPGTKYPAVLFITGDGDTRVAPLHARKMAALLQAATGSDPKERPVILRYDTKAGHSGGLPVTKIIEDMTDELRFLFAQLGVNAQGT
jgi:prolyl oligopeptidase